MDEQKLIEIAVAAAVKATQQSRTKEAGSPPTWNTGHGTGGIFSFPGLEPSVANAMVMPNLGLLSILPSRTSMSDTPLHGIFTGVTASTGDEPVGVCDNPPVAGLSKMCTHKSVWGRFSRKSPIIDITSLGRIINRSEFMDLEMIGNPLTAENILVPGAPNASQVLKNEVAKVIFEMSVAMGRDFVGIAYTGTPTNNTADGGYKEPYGMDVLINTGYQDAETDQLCPAADSIIMSFGDAEINTHGDDAVRRFTGAYRNAKFIAQRAGLMPVKWVWAMPWAMFYELTEVWPCSYLSYRCKTQDTAMIDAVPSVNASDQIALRDKMRNDQALLIDGEYVPVVLDDGIAETVLAGETFEASAYLVPVRVLGNRPATYLEYFNFEGPGAAMDFVKQMGGPANYWTTNGGRYIWHAQPPTNWCNRYVALTQWRIILETPHIAARITDIRYTPLKHQRGSLPTDTSFYVNGGRTGRDVFTPSYYPPTHSEQTRQD